MHPEIRSSEAPGRVVEMEARGGAGPALSSPSNSAASPAGSGHRPAGPDPRRGQLEAKAQTACAATARSARLGGLGQVAHSRVTLHASHAAAAGKGT